MTETKHEARLRAVQECKQSVNQHSKEARWTYGRTKKELDLVKRVAKKKQSRGEW